MGKTDPEDAVQSWSRVVPARRGLERKFPVGDNTRQGIGQQRREATLCRVSGRPVRWVESQGIVPDGARHRVAQTGAEHAQGIASEGGARVRNGLQAIDRGARQRHLG